MKPTPIFNPQGNDSIANRSIWFGETTNLMQLNDVRYQWAVQLYQQMRGNFWIPQRIDITQDVNDYTNLTDYERYAFDGILSYLTFLDSTQTCNIPHLKLPITAPEISLCMAEQISQEGMHNQSYQYMIETIIPSDKRSAVYDFWRTNKILKERCEYIAGLYQKYVDEPTNANYFMALLADYVLEGIYFYTGFNYFYTLASRHLMAGSADIFRMINRDELSHVRLYQKILPEAMDVLPNNLDDIYVMFAEAAEQEINWTNHIIGDNILGITSQSTDQYVKFLVNKRLKAIGLSEIYPGYNKSPYGHLEKFADAEGEANTKANFFEATVTSYMMSSTVGDWDSF